MYEISVSETGTAGTIRRGNWAVGNAFASAALQARAESGIEREKIQFIGSQGQTIQHIPVVDDLAGYPSRGTLQIGEPAVIASRTGILTVADFRAADMAAGGLSTKRKLRYKVLKEYRRAQQEMGLPCTTLAWLWQYCLARCYWILRIN